STALSAQDRARAGDKFQPQGMNAEDRETLERQYRRQLTERWTEAEKSEVQDLIQASFERIEKDEQEQPGVFLVEQMRKAVNPFIRAKAVRLLAEKYPANLMNIAADGLFDKDSRVRETAAQSLAASPHLRTFLGYPSFQDFLLIASSDECEGVRYWAKRCLDQVKYWADK
ncbi:MAG TPA: HEAT repeat domain-containing protein, partial [Anaerolineales bacterium]|nr:HEAT repeat domain-containing protein [Anaerolineales bacterium]